MSNSKKITELTEARNITDYNNSYFVVANADNNKKLSYNTLKSSILKGTEIETFKPETINDFNTLTQLTENKILTGTERERSWLLSVPTIMWKIHKP